MNKRVMTMKVIVVGCGKVGYALAEALCSENHDVTVIDNNEEKIERISNTLDVASVKGNGASYRVLQDAGVEDCDVLIAATSQDEVNMLCCLIARKAAQCKTIARVRDPNYYSEIGFIQEELGLSMAINPELSAASECYHLVRAPFATELDSFAKDKVEMITFTLPSTSPWVGQKLMNLKRSSSYLLAIVVRNHKAMIPNGNTELEKGDRISLVVDKTYIRDALTTVGLNYKPIKNVIIAAGGNVGYYLAQRLCEKRIQVTIIEPNRERCEELTHLLPKAVIVHGNPCEERVLLEEGLDQTDAFCALMGSDSENIMMSLFVSKFSNAKIITRINKISTSVIEDLPLGAIVCPKDLTAEHIFRYVRAMDSSKRSSSMETVYRLAGDQVEALAFNVRSESAITNRPLMNLSIRSGVLVCAIIRNNHVIIPSGRDSILPGDDVVIVSTTHGIYDLPDILK